MHPKASVALMKFLSGAARRLGVGDHAYVVGGAVRNYVLGVPIKDVDLVIDPTVQPGKDSAWFAKQLQKLIPAPTSLVTNNYGVAILSVNGPWVLGGHDLDGEKIEIANARSESYAEGGYKPDQVVPATIQEDVYRREFTFNTLLWRLKDLAQGPDKAEIIDLTGCGLRDLERGVMACPRDPDEVFADDPSRMIRAVKFTIKYGFKIPPDLEASIRRNASRLRQIPPGHITNMLIETFLRDPSGKKALMEMDRLGLLAVIREIAQDNKSFRQSLANWAESEASVAFLFDLMDLGMPVGKKLTFLSPEDVSRVREVTFDMTPAKGEAYVSVLKQPGRVLDFPSLIQEFDLKGPGVGVLTDVARRSLLEDPDLIDDSRRFSDQVRQRLMSKRVASRVLASVRRPSVEESDSPREYLGSPLSTRPDYGRGSSSRVASRVASRWLASRR
jgi:tRNA nucleotidyltransferase/poly(A) polymerase